MRAWKHQGVMRIAGELDREVVLETVEKRGQQTVVKLGSMDSTRTVSVVVKEKLDFNRLCGCPVSRE